jgi:hypothetical protein
MQELGIEPTYNPFPGYDYPIKDILNMFSENKNKWNWQSKKRIKL